MWCHPGRYGGARQLDPYIVLGSAVVGFLVGVTGAGGGALMTPMLILLFGVKPSTAISSDLVAAVVMRPIGAAVHLRRGTVNLRLVGWLMVGSVPMAFLGTYLLHLMGNAKAAEKNVQIALGAALLAGAAAMVLRYVLDRRTGQTRQGVVHDLRVHPLSTVAIGMISRGTGTRLMMCQLSTSELVPVLQAMVKKLKGTRPQRTKVGKCRMLLLGKIFVNTKVKVPMITSGFSRDQNTPRDMFR